MSKVTPAGAEDDEKKTRGINVCLLKYELTANKKLNCKIISTKRINKDLLNSR